MTDDNKYELIRKKLQNDELDLHETVQWDEYLKKPKNQREFTDLKGKWELAGKIEVELPVNTEKAWERFNTSRTGLRTISWYQKDVFKIAASLLLLATFAGVYFFLNPSLTTETVTTGPGEQKEFTLPDGSKVWLNQNSGISYLKNDYGSTFRKVEMKGEVYFDVERNESIPFQVSVDEARIQVLGTSFNVNAGTLSKPLEVLVTSGKVSLFSEESSDEKLILTRGETGTFNWDNGTLKKAEESSHNKISWQSNKLIFKESRLEDVLNDLEKHFGITIKVQNPDIMNCRFTSTFSDPQLSEVMEAITISLDLNSSSTGNKSYILTGKGC